MNTIEISNELIQFIESSPSMFHSIKTIRTYLDEAGFTYLPESKAWDVKAGGKYYAIRNHSSLIAFKVGNDLDSYHFQMWLFTSTVRSIMVINTIVKLICALCFLVEPLRRVLLTRWLRMNWVLRLKIS